MRPCWHESAARHQIVKLVAEWPGTESLVALCVFRPDWVTRVDLPQLGAQPDQQSAKRRPYRHLNLVFRLPLLEAEDVSVQINRDPCEADQITEPLTGVKTSRDSETPEIVRAFGIDQSQFFQREGPPLIELLFGMA